MYNRYVPAEDGTYRRQVVGNHKSAPAPPSPKSAPPSPVKQADSPTATTSLFLGLDTADLLILLILILVMMDDGRDNTTLLLTAALYFLLQ